MKQVLFVLMFLVLAGCIATEADTPPTQPEVEEEEPAPVVEEEPEPVVEEEVAAVMPEEHECMELEGDRSFSDVIKVHECFNEKEEYVECVYFMLRDAREIEIETNLVRGWPVRLYSKAMQCAKDAEELPNADDLPEGMWALIYNYYICYDTDSICVTTPEEMDALVEEVAAARHLFV